MSWLKGKEMRSPLMEGVDTYHGISRKIHARLNNYIHFDMGNCSDTVVRGINHSIPDSFGEYP